MAGLTLTELWRFPVKSLRGTRCASLTIDSRGPVGDRRWMLVDVDGQFLTQRQLPRMSLIDTELTERGIRLSYADSSLEVAQPGKDAPSCTAQVWRDRVLARLAEGSAHQWLSEMLGQSCRLVYQPSDQVRQVDQRYARADDRVSFADGFPFLLISQASLDELNSRLEHAVPMLRFRPNLVVSGCEPYAEDSWQRIRIGDLSFRVAKPCSRCVIPTIDPATAQRAAEPMRTLSSYRRRDNRVYFGQNLLHDGLGSLSEGMPVEVLR